jgi:hypothetical protein
VPHIHACRGRVAWCCPDRQEAQLLLDSGLAPGQTMASRAIGYRQAMEFLQACREDAAAATAEALVSTACSWAAGPPWGNAWAELGRKPWCLLLASPDVFSVDQLLVSEQWGRWLGKAWAWVWGATWSRFRVAGPRDTAVCYNTVLFLHFEAPAGPRWP